MLLSKTYDAENQISMNSFKGGLSFLYLRIAVLHLSTAQLEAATRRVVERYVDKMSLDVETLRLYQL